MFCLICCYFVFSLVYCEARPSSRKFYLCAKKCPLQKFGLKKNGNRFWYHWPCTGTQKVLKICCHLCPSLNLCDEKKWQQKNETSLVLFFNIIFFTFFSTFLFSICVFCALCMMSVWLLIRHSKQKNGKCFFKWYISTYYNGQNDHNVLPLTGPKVGFKNQILCMRIIGFLGTLRLEEFWSVFFSCWNQMVEFTWVIQKRGKKVRKNCTKMLFLS